MKTEYSYGAVVYRKIGDKVEFLIEYMTLGHISIPKGHIEKGETEEECALREIKEETNLDVELDINFSHTISYSPKEGVYKYVTFYLAKAISDNIISQLEEVTKTNWVDIDTAIKEVTFDTDKETLKEAYEYMKSHHLA